MSTDEVSGGRSEAYRWRHMKVTVVAAAELGLEQQSCWTRIQRLDPALAGPFFCVEFTLATASVRRDVCVGILERDRQTVGFFPFQRAWPRVGRPVADLVSDYHGVVSTPGTAWRADQLLRACRLSGYEFNHLLASQEPFQPYHQRQAPSPIIDLSAGYESYRKERREAGSEQLKKLEGLARKMEYEVGPLRMEPHVADPAMLNKVIGLKTGHYVRKGYKNVLSVTWVRRLVERLHATQGSGFAGMLSVLYAGDRFVAAHMGLRSKTVWHYWFPTYDEEFTRYSPGLILLMRMAQCAPELGITTIDLGKGDGGYKRRFMNGSIMVAEGQVYMSPLAGAVRQTGRRVRRLLGRMSTWRPTSFGL